MAREGYDSAASALDSGATDKQFRLMVDAVFDFAVFILDADGFIMTWNAGAEHIKHYAASEVMGRHFSLFYPREAVDRMLPQHALNMAAEQGYFQEEGWRLRKGGSRFWAGVTITAIREDGRLVGFGKIIRDLTERRLAESHLNRVLERREREAAEAAESHRQLQSITDSLSDGLLEVDFDWNIRFGNRGAAQMLPDFGIGKNVWKCFPDLIGTFVEEHMRRAMYQRAFITYENYYLPYDIWLRVRLSPSQHGLAFVFSDITREKRLEEQLNIERLLREKRTAALSQMAAGLAHEISNPLAIIHATASELSMTLAERDTETRRQALKSSNHIVYMADRASKILKGLRGFAREAEQEPLEWASLYEIVQESIEPQRARFEDEQIHVEVHLDDDLPPFLCRSTQIGQIVTNLVNNAFDAIGQSKAPDRWVRITGSQQGRFLLLSVADSGPGIPEDFRKHLMEAFFTTKIKGLGMGIGLSLSRAFAEDHGGTLKLRAEQTPTCLDLRLPIEPHTVINSLATL